MDQPALRRSHSACPPMRPDAAGPRKGAGGRLDRKRRRRRRRFHVGRAQRRRSRPTYVTQPREFVTVIVTPPPRVAAQLTLSPRMRATTGRPATATCARCGAKASSTVTSDPRAATAALREAAIGAPQRARQHHDEIASLTTLAPAWSVAFGGPASARAAISGTTCERYRGDRKKEFGARRKIRPSSANPDVESAPSEGEPE